MYEESKWICHQSKEEETFTTLGNGIYHRTDSLVQNVTLHPDSSVQQNFDCAQHKLPGSVQIKPCRTPHTKFDIEVQM